MNAGFETNEDFLAFLDNAMEKLEHYIFSLVPLDLACYHAIEALNNLWIMVKLEQIEQTKEEPDL